MTPLAKTGESGTAKFLETHFGTSTGLSPSSTTWNAMMLPSRASPCVRSNLISFDGGPHIGKYTQRSLRPFTTVEGAPHTPIDAYDSSSLPALIENSGVR